MSELALLGGKKAVTMQAPEDLFKWPIVTKEEEEAVNRILAGLGFVKSNFKDITGTAKQRAITPKRICLFSSGIAEKSNCYFVHRERISGIILDI